MLIRTATMKDLDRITEVEALCFPMAEAADRDEFKERLTVYPDHFILLFDGDRLVSFVNGMVTDEQDLSDRMYADASLHREDGAWQMIFGVNTIPDMRHKGCAALLIKEAIEKAKKQNRKGVVLTCKEHMLTYYEKFGFVNEGISKSVHGNVVWYQMRLKF